MWIYRGVRGAKIPKVVKILNISRKIDWSRQNFEIFRIFFEILLKKVILIKMQASLMEFWKFLIILNEIKKQQQIFARLGKIPIKIWNFLKLTYKTLKGKLTFYPFHLLYSRSLAGCRIVRGRVLYKSLWYGMNRPVVYNYFMLLRSFPISKFFSSMFSQPTVFKRKLYCHFKISVSMIIIWNSICCYSLNCLYGNLPKRKISAIFIAVLEQQPLWNKNKSLMNLRIRICDITDGEQPY